MAANKETKLLLERRYGKFTIQQAMEESFTNDWLKQHSKQCPGCGAHIQVILSNISVKTTFKWSNDSLLQLEKKT